jgi:hypothetical protein
MKVTKIIRDKHKTFNNLRIHLNFLQRIENI